MTRLQSFGPAAALFVLLFAGSGFAQAQSAPGSPTGTPAETVEPPATQAVPPGSATPAAPAESTPTTSEAPAPAAPAAGEATAPVAPAGTGARPSADTGTALAPDGAPAAAPAAASAQPADTSVGTPEPSAAPAPASFAGPLPPELSGSSIPHDLSPWGMFLAADWVVKAVMIGLVFASLVTWTIWLAKALELGFAKRRAGAQVRQLEAAASLDAALADGRRPLRSGPVAALAQTAAAERALSDDLSADGVKERVAVALQRIEARSGRRMARGTGLLATIGSTAPFVGLFGTVWGIMNSFIGIAEANTTNLAVVAPGIAEALLATAIGLVAAIPAVIIYNVFARSIAGYRSILSDGSAAVLRHLSRDLDRRDRGVVAGASRPYAAAAE